jgi:hypothetical protein
MEINNVGDLINILKTLPPETKIYSTESEIVNDEYYSNYTELFSAEILNCGVMLDFVRVLDDPTEEAIRKGTLMPLPISTTTIQATFIDGGRGTLPSGALLDND